MILVYVHSWGDEGCSGTSHTVFEYESKEKFVFDVLEKFKNKEWKTFGSGHFSHHEEAPLFSNSDDITLNKFEVEHIEHDVFTLEEWSKRNLQDLKVL